jgi:RNA polymerase nonessential primary-like sigma factor
MPTVNSETENLNAKFTADMVRTYLREIGRVPLLTREQEIVFGKQVQLMMTLLEAKEALAKNLDHEPSLAEWAAHVKQSENEVKQTVAQGKRAKQKND